MGHSGFYIINLNMKNHPVMLPQGYKVE